MLIQIVSLYAVTWLASAGVAAVLEWAQLVRTAPLGRALGLVKAVAIGWTALPFAAPALLLVPLLRRSGTSGRPSWRA